MVTTAPVPWMSSLKQRNLSCIFSRMAKALSVAKSSNCIKQPAARTVPDAPDLLQTQCINALMH